MAYRPHYMHGEIIYQKSVDLGSISRHPKFIFTIRIEDKDSFNLVAVSDKKQGQISSEHRSFYFNHGSKSLIKGFRWFRKKTPHGYAMGLIESDGLVHARSSVKRRSKTFIEVFSSFEYKLVQRAHARYKEKFIKNQRIKNETRK